VAGNANPACALVTTAEAATVLGAPVTETRPGYPDPLNATCQFFAGQYPNYTAILDVYKQGPPGAKSRFDVDKFQNPLISGLGDGAFGWNAGGSGIADVVALKGDWTIKLSLQIPAKLGVVPPPVPDSVFNAMKTLMSTALTRI
jgi:hypothetical protein